MHFLTYSAPMRRVVLVRATTFPTVKPCSVFFVRQTPKPMRVSAFYSRAYFTEHP